MLEFKESFPNEDDENSLYEDREAFIKENYPEGGGMECKNFLIAG